MQPARLFLDMRITVQRPDGFTVTPAKRCLDQVLSPWVTNAYEFDEPNLTDQASGERADAVS
jgi:hypothetical protein